MPTYTANLNGDELRVDSLAALSQPIKLSASEKFIITKVGHLAKLHGCMIAGLLLHGDGETSVWVELNPLAYKMIWHVCVCVCVCANVHCCYGKQCMSGHNSELGGAILDETRPLYKGHLTWTPLYIKDTPLYKGYLTWTPLYIKDTPLYKGYLTWTPLYIKATLLSPKYTHLVRINP